MNLRNILEIFELLRAGRAPQRLVTGLVMSMSASCSVIIGHDHRLSRPFTLLVPEMATTAEKKNPASFLPSATGDPQSGTRMNDRPTPQIFAFIFSEYKFINDVLTLENF